jgi:hypothetical protein
MKSIGLGGVSDPGSKGELEKIVGRLGLGLLQLNPHLGVHSPKVLILLFSNSLALRHLFREGLNGF